jgi:hypothetical protein
VDIVRSFRWRRQRRIRWLPKHWPGQRYQVVGRANKCRPNLALPLLDAGAQLVEQLAEQRLLVVGEPLAQARVVADGDPAEAVEQRLARGRELERPTSSRWSVPARVFKNGKLIERPDESEGGDQQVA